MKGSNSMLIAVFYVLLCSFFVLFGWLFGLDQANFASVWTYLLLLADFILSYILAFVSVLGITSILGEFRKKKQFDNKFNHYFAQSLLRLALHLARIKTVVTGLENIPKDNKFIFVCNHQENFDIPVLSPIFKGHPMCFIAKEALFNATIIGKWINLLGNVPIGKNADRDAAKSIIMGIKRHKEGLPFGIFPEGMRARSNEMIEFKPGAFKLAMKPKSNILIGTIYDMGKIFKSIPWKRYVVRVHFHPLLPYQEYKELNSQEISANVKAIIQSKLDEFNKKSPQV